MKLPHWADNFCKKILIEKFEKTNFFLNYTVFACIPFTIDKETDYLLDGIDATTELPVFHKSYYFTDVIQLRIKELIQQFNPQNNFYYIYDFNTKYSFLKIPIRSSVHKVKTLALDVHDIPAGNVHGVCNIIQSFAALSIIRNDTNFHYFILEIL